MNLTNNELYVIAILCFVIGISLGIFAYALNGSKAKKQALKRATEPKADAVAVNIKKAPEQVPEAPNDIKQMNPDPNPASALVSGSMRTIDRIRSNTPKDIPVFYKDEARPLIPKSLRRKQSPDWEECT